MVDKFAELISFLGHNLIQGIFMSVLPIILVRLISKNKIETYFSAQIIRWIIIIYTFGAIINTMFLLIFEHSEEYAFLNKATGQDWWFYLLLLVTNSILPLILLNKKIGGKLKVLFVIALLMNKDWIFESFVIHVTSIKGNYITEDYNPYLPNSRETTILINGFFIGFFSLIIGNGIKKWKEKLDK